MSNISKALKRIQESRQGPKEAAESGDIVYLSDKPKTWPKTLMMVIFCFVTVLAILDSTAAIVLTMRSSNARQVEILELERNLKAQEKRINDLVIGINKNQKFSDSQIRELNLYLKEESINTKTQINNLTSTESTHYADLKSSLMDDKDNINILNKYTNIINQKLKDMSEKIDQPKEQAVVAPVN